jgi:hypothetical protein
LLSSNAREVRDERRTAGKFSVNTARLTAFWVSHMVADSEKRRSVFLFAKIDLARWGKVTRQGNIKPE